MPSITITRGLPASGKTTYAMSWLARPLRARVNRDDLRVMFHDRSGILGNDEENTITHVQESAVSAHLRAGRHVIVDDMHLRVKYVRHWADLAAQWGVPFHVQDFALPVQSCVTRDAARGRSVGGDVIRKLATRFRIPATGELPALPDLTPRAPRPAAEYTPDPWLPGVYLVDIDGTVAVMNGRSPYDWARVGEDTVNTPVVDVVRAVAQGHEIVYLSGRDGSCEDTTVAWLSRHALPPGRLIMRAPGDTRHDDVVKRELFDRHIRDRYRVLGVFDDRDRVVIMWRSLGLTVFQVAPGAF